ncbi:MAG: hypothetical protein KBS59_05965 [Clostridiales bacterium]|nr:hypothetical protein [Clostridiales bacterium]
MTNMKNDVTKKEFEYVSGGYITYDDACEYYYGTVYNMYIGGGYMEDEAAKCAGEMLGEWKSKHTPESFPL